ncbi:hypothetical protein LY28_02363 [Ruminiclostridium sufflavum DSM 19573]|uniref:Uncharacterized protein n=1 Tax=Ruminiclostridium sufflavum DSM 19573 TaxID=1121337 RepID=A0A318XJ63_9FIRM|nr:hypothetical protein [Ruminiclostridium sufflavum]PYG87225.1 hypothetical protein LY28_02363 [Ruminiclostridium sufflavum DSM 19573]
MDFIKSYSLVKSQNSNDLVLYFDEGTMDTEFADGLGDLGGKGDSLSQSILQSIAQIFPDKKINTVKIMFGSFLLSSFTVTKSPSIQLNNIT